MESRNLEYMFYGFLAAWLIVLAYVLSLAMREGRLRREIDRVRRMVEKK
ncbi:MAG TPA: CcmD family protein [Bryobacteraceae bacterium]|jgi:CcmD family protein|nr:CcmD family protein [Bryobacteraceae bacterium]